MDLLDLRAAVAKSLLIFLSLMFTGAARRYDSVGEQFLVKSFNMEFIKRCETRSGAWGRWSCVTD